MEKNVFRNTKVEYHILQSFPVTCLNRDDAGAPKTAIIGGKTRARVSSQCWKRQVRMVMNDLGAPHGIRTKMIADLIKEACLEKGATDEQAKACGDKTEQAFIKKAVVSKKPKNKSDQEDEESSEETSEADKADVLIFLSPGEINMLAQAFCDNQFDPACVITQKEQKKQAKEVADLVGRKIDGSAYDIALFGRMVAQAASMNVEAACSFAHAISTHAVANEVEFFTALDDRPGAEPGAAHMGSLEFNSATYYRYISVDLGQLAHVVGVDHVKQAMEYFTKALFLAVPAARQTTQSGACPWEYAKILVRKGQRIQMPFEKPVGLDDGGYLENSKWDLCNYLTIKEQEWGSLFGKISEYTFGDEDHVSIDTIMAGIQNDVERIQHG